MEGVPFVGNGACAHNLLLKGRPLIMCFRQLPPNRYILAWCTWRQTMNIPRPFDEPRIGNFVALVTMAFTICLAVRVPANAQCAGLHAGITAQLVQLKPGYTEPAHIQLIFLLINDSDSPLDVDAASWKIVVDGVELSDSGWIFGNGPMPTDGWNSLQPGQYYELGKALPVDKYFPHAGEHKVSWRGQGFRSATITV